MSDQTPPPGQPTPPPAGGAGDGVNLGKDAPPPPPVDPPGPPAGGASPVSPTPEGPKSRKGLLIGVVAALLVLALVGGAIAAIQLARAPEEHSITVTSSAGGMKRDTTQEKALKSQLTATEEQFEQQFKVDTVKAGLYEQEKESRGPKGQMLFVGFEFKKASEKNPARLVKQLRSIAKSNKLEVTDISTGDDDSKGVCLGTPAEAAQQSTSCFWFTRDSGGGLFPNVPGYDVKQVSKLLRDVRADVEKTE